MASYRALDEGRTKYMEKKRVPVITGMGIVSSIGNGVDTFAKALSEGTCGIAKHYEKDDETEIEYLAAEVRDFSFATYIKSFKESKEELNETIVKTCRRYPDTVKMNVAAAAEAYYMAKGWQNHVAPERKAVITAGSNYNCNYQFQNYKKSLKQFNLTSPSYAMNFMDTDLNGLLSELFSIHGEGISVGGASASGNVGIIKAMQLIESGEADWCMVEGPVSDLSCVEIMSLKNLGAMGGKKFADEPQSACRPFDEQHEGFILGQASACLILEAKDNAEARNADILAELPGASIQLHGSRLTEANELYEKKVMETAWNKTGMDIVSLDYINTHGTSTPMGDETELRAIRDFCGDRVSEVYLNSTKSLTGHCFFSAGIVETVACVIQLNQGFLHPNRNLNKPVMDGFLFCREKAIKKEIHTAVNNSFGFGGINTSIVIRK